MSQEQRDSYVIPPNFIEGGSFFGGLFKARNVVEAVILAAGTGLPILTLSLTLTVRIILLCLTSLPLALLALIGIAGMPLSSYIILFFRFLRNRRTLSKSGGKSSRKQQQVKKSVQSFHNFIFSRLYHLHRNRKEHISHCSPRRRPDNRPCPAKRDRTFSTYRPCPHH